MEYRERVAGTAADRRRDTAGRRGASGDRGSRGRCEPAARTRRAAGPSAVTTTAVHWPDGARSRVRTQPPWSTVSSPPWTCSSGSAGSPPNPPSRVLVDDVEVCPDTADEADELRRLLPLQQRVPAFDELRPDAQLRARGRTGRVFIALRMDRVRKPQCAATRVEERPALRGRMHPGPAPPVDLTVRANQRSRAAVGEQPVRGDRRRRRVHEVDEKCGSSSPRQNSRKPAWSGPTWCR